MTPTTRELIDVAVRDRRWAQGNFQHLAIIRAAGLPWVSRIHLAMGVGFYGPVIGSGFAAWHQESGNYWGHNAIIRTQAFAQAAGLPTLPGAPPLGGHVQSHDFV